MSPVFFPRDEYFMRLALREAERALEHDDVPIGAVVVYADAVIGAGHNERELRGDPTAHAELLALGAAAAVTGAYAGEELRQRAGERLGVPDPALALLEDVAAVTAGLLVLRGH